MQSGLIKSLASGDCFTLEPLSPSSNGRKRKEAAVGVEFQRPPLEVHSSGGQGMGTKSSNPLILWLFPLATSHILTFFPKVILLLTWGLGLL